MFPRASQQLITGGTFNSYITQPHTGLKAGYERLIESVATNALHDSGHVFDPPKCHPGTRVAIIQTITDWIDGVNDVLVDKNITWVTGAAGAGKSAIARSVCECCTEKGALLAGFFFCASDAIRNHSRSLVATIAYQISLSNPGIRSVISDAIDHDPLIFTRSLRTQFTSLIINPLLPIFSTECRRAAVLIVIDGLDECEDLDSQRDILDTIVYVSLVSHLPIRFLLCSRPENQILQFFSLPKAQGTLFKIFLGDEYSPNKDIELYLSERFESIKEGHIFKSSIPKDWPRKEHIKEIVEKSSGQFIYAATIVRYVDSSRHRPHQRLEAILGLRPPFSDLPFSQLDALYIHILSTSSEPALSTDILAFPALYPSPLADTAENILGLGPGDVELLLSDLGSIIQIDANKELKLLHRSFADFLFDPQRSRRFSKDRTELKALHALRLMQFFSEQQEYCKIKFYNANTTMLLDYVHVDWDTILAYREALSAMTRFPMKSFCVSIFTHEHGCLDAIFLTYFFPLLGKDTTNTNVTEAYHRQVQAFCECILSELRRKYIEDWEVNYAFSSAHLKMKDTISHHHFENNLALALSIVSTYSLPSNITEKINSTFQRLLTSEETSSTSGKTQPVNYAEVGIKA